MLHNRLIVLMLIAVVAAGCQRARELVHDLTAPAAEPAPAVPAPAPDVPIPQPQPAPPPPVPVPPAPVPVAPPAPPTPVAQVVVEPKPLPPLLDRARASLRATGLNVAPDAVSQEGPDLVVVLEASAAADFDEQLLLQWAQCFGALGALTEQAVHVVTTAGGVPLVRVTAQRGDILALAHGDMELSVFVTHLQFTSLQVQDGDSEEAGDVPEAAAPPVKPKAVPAYRPKPRPRPSGPFIRAHPGR